MLPVGSSTDIEKARLGRLLTADDKTILKADQEVAAARLTVQRLDALLPALHEDLARAEGRETVMQLRAEAEATASRIAALTAWQEEELPKVWELIARGFMLEDAATAASGQFLNSVKAAYERREVREAGPIGVAVPDLPAARTHGTIAHAFARQ
jgi:regulator of protease activity HflC (stomatin/prohibitin superfamily)